MCVRASPSCKGAPSLAVAVLGGRCCDVTHSQFAASHKAWKAEPEVRAGAQVAAGKLDNRELDKLVGALGRSRATWRRALLLHEWLLGLGHAPDDRLCTTLIRVCAQHGQVGATGWHAAQSLQATGLACMQRAVWLSTYRHVDSLVLTLSAFGILLCVLCGCAYHLTGIVARRRP
jgi:hypothetical protein